MVTMGLFFTVFENNIKKKKFLNNNFIKIYRIRVCLWASNIFKLLSFKFFLTISFTYSTFLFESLHVYCFLKHLLENS